MDNNEIEQSLADPELFERKFRNNRREFLDWFNQVAQDYPDAQIVRFWKARLSYEAPAAKAAGSRSILFVVVLSIVASVLVKLHELQILDEDWYLARIVPLIVIASLVAYFFKPGGTPANRTPLLYLSAGTLVALFLPEAKGSSSITMALIHLPFVYLSALALAFMQGNWKSLDARIQFLQYLGEVIIYSAIILLGGIVLTAVTFALFEAIDVKIFDWYMSYIVVSGLVSAPIVASYLYDSVLGRNSRISHLLANIFSPLFLLTVLGYLLIVIIQGKSPVTDRDFLITFNGLLLVVLAITFFSISWRSDDDRIGTGHYVNFGLLAITLAIDIYALLAILLRLYEFGLTPNRFVVTGANLIIFVHLLVVSRNYYRVLRSGSSIQLVTNSIAAYLPVYALWSAFVVCGLPLIFWFE